MAPDDQFQSVPSSPAEPPLGPALQSLGVLECFEEAWNLYARLFWWIFGIQIAWVLITKVVGFFSAGLLPVFLLFFVTMPLGLGYNRIFIRFARGEKPQATDWYVGFSRYGRVLGMFLGYAVLGLVAMLPFGIALLVNLFSQRSINPIVGFLGFVYMIGVALMGIYIVFVFSVMADITKVGVMEAFQTAVDLVKGNWAKVLGLLASLLPISLVGMLLTSLPQFVRAFAPDLSVSSQTVLWIFFLPGSAIMAFASLVMNRGYVKLRSINGLPEPPVAETVPTAEPGPELPMEGV